MHNLALALHSKGYKVSGSDDEIVEPSASRLRAKGLLPAQFGWYPEKIKSNLDAIILGMHARLDNPELIRAQELGLKIYSYPEYIYEQSKDKIRVVIGGSHGKTTITSMIMHVLKSQGLDFDYMVGSQIEGFDTMVRLSHAAPIIILEGDEYLASPIDRRPKFHLYHPHIALLSGIAWDHINVFPTFELYKEQFEIFIDLIEKDGDLIWCERDEFLKSMVLKVRKDVHTSAYSVPQHEIVNGKTYLRVKGQKIPLLIFGEHNLMNAEGARLICNRLGVTDENYYKEISTFSGAARRLELVAENTTTAFFKDFAHSPSKLKATTDALKKQFPNRKLIACMELHTFSSLSENFLDEYRDSMSLADEAIVYFNPHTLSHKKLKSISEEQVKQAFGGSNLIVITDSKLMEEKFKAMNWEGKNLLMMSSGTFDGINFKQLGESMLSN